MLLDLALAKPNFSVILSLQELHPSAVQPQQALVR